MQFEKGVENICLCYFAAIQTWLILHRFLIPKCSSPMIRVLNSFLCVSIAIGIILLVSQRIELASLKAELAPLVAKHGALIVEDPDKYLITKIETGDSKHFLWRVYHPAGLNLLYRSGTTNGSNSTGTSQNSSSYESLYRIRFEFIEDRLYVDSLSNTGGSKISIGGKKLVKFLEHYWEELDIEALANDATTELATDELLSLLTIRVPDDLWGKFEKAMGNRAKHYREGLFYSQRGTQEAFTQYEQQSQAGQ